MKIAAKLLALAASMLVAEEREAMSGEERLSFYNDNAERFGLKPVARFSNSAQRDKKLIELATAIQAAAAEGPKAKAPASDADRSAAIAATWTNPAVAEARKARHGVKVGKETYPSMRKAFEALGLDVNKHGAVRAKLVASGAVDFGGHKFARA